MPFKPINSVMSVIKKMPILYKHSASPPARAAMMVADVLGVKYEPYHINPVQREQDTPEMTMKNPLRTIPYLEDDGFCLGDSHAIILYLFDKYSKPEHSYLYPKDPIKRAKINQVLFFDCGVLFPRLRSVMALTYTGRLSELSTSMKHNIDDGYRILEAYLSDTLYVADDSVTLADFSVVTTVSSLHGLHPIDSDKYQKLQQWYNRMSEQRVCKAINQPGADLHVAGLKALMENTKNNKLSKL